MRREIVIGSLALFALVTGVYSNHFHNAFHFDDFHTIVQNPYITKVSNIPRFFEDARTTSVLPANRVWRPLVFASLAIDYWLGNAMDPFWFHVSTFLWFLIQLALMAALFRGIFDKIRPHPWNPWLALFGTALYGCHPAVAETVNYIVQRADVYSTLGVIAALAMYVFLPRLQKYGLYLLPLAAGILSKPPALVLPLLLFLYLWLIDEERPGDAARRSVPSLIAVGALLALTSAMTPRTFTPGATSGYAYRITQPAAIARYFRTFFVPVGLTADTDRTPYETLFNSDVLFGFAIVVGLILLAWWSSKRRETRPIAFGLFWFLVALLPTSLFPLAEVENDHRMFFPFVGLALSVSWAAALWLYSRPRQWPVYAAAAALALAGLGAGTWQRNRVWHTEESLWYDVTLKSPRNGRGLMNYGLTQMQKGDLLRALNYFEKALVYTPAYYILDINLGVVNGALHRDADAEKYFRLANQLAPSEATPHYFYAAWLRGQGRLSEAAQNLNIAIANNPSYLDAAHLLMDIYAEQHDAASLRKVATDTLAQFPSDSVAKSWLARADTLGSATLTPENFLNQSLIFYRQGRFKESIEAARQALKLRPGYSDAWNNIAAAYNSQSMWDAGIRAAEEAVRLDPGNQLAKNNLAWAIQQKKK